MLPHEDISPPRFRIVKDRVPSPFTLPGRSLGRREYFHARPLRRGGGPHARFLGPGRAHPWPVSRRGRGFWEAEDVSGQLLTVQAGRLRGPEAIRSDEYSRGIRMRYHGGGRASSASRGRTRADTCPDGLRWAGLLLIRWQMSE